MYKKILLFVLITSFISLGGLAQSLTSVGASSEWEATGFNNGRRVVRDNNEFLHIVWHSQEDPGASPMGLFCHIYYACVSHTGVIIVPPQNLTIKIPELIDSRYPSIAIEYEAPNDQYYWTQYNQIHLVWQGLTEESSTYDIYYHPIQVFNPPTAPWPFNWSDVRNLSNSMEVDSLVPAIAINQYRSDPNIDQNIHVVWQEEDVNGEYGFDAAASEIFYAMSWDCGLNWTAPANLTNTELNSQMPSISCALDSYYGTPPQYNGLDAAYLSNDVHVAYHEDTNAGGINVYYLQSPDNGVTWNAPTNLSPSEEVGEGYPNIAVDMQDRFHIVCMTNLIPGEPMQNGYFPGVDPVMPASFPAAYPGMYHYISNSVKYYGYAPWITIWGDQEYDREFPTIALDRKQHLDFNWQEHYYDLSGNPSYDVMRIECTNTTPITRPLSVPFYPTWGTFINKDSINPEFDYLFPNLAHKKVAMYLNGFTGSDNIFSEVWTKIGGVGRSYAIAPLAKIIEILSDALRDPGFY
jgi:hypothetical protein